MFAIFVNYYVVFSNKLYTLIDNLIFKVDKLSHFTKLFKENIFFKTGSKFGHFAKKPFSF